MILHALPDYPLILTPQLSRLAQPFDYPEGWDTNETAFNMGVSLQMRKGGRGWYIDNNVLKECEAGNYCPFNETLGYFDRMVECSDGEVCYNKVHEPYKCSDFHICNGKVRAPRW